jgi:hypothetical protein
MDQFGYSRVKAVNFLGGKAMQQASPSALWERHLSSWTKAAERKTTTRGENTPCVPAPITHQDAIAHMIRPLPEPQFS